jgi:hypothetical protein
MDLIVAVRELDLREKVPGLRDTSTLRALQQELRYTQASFELLSVQVVLSQV